MPNSSAQNGEELTMEALRARLQAAELAATNATAALEAANLLFTGAKRKPELPNLDLNNIEIWLRRVESAYIRANVTSAKEKFAHLEPKIDVSLNPRINQFLYGQATDANWTAFVAYMKSEYGTSISKKAALILDPISRDGRRPSSVLATLEDQTKDLTLDDVIKEKIMRMLPIEVQRNLAERFEESTSQELAVLADSYFAKDGSILHPPAASGISSIRHPEEDQNDLPDDSINAVQPKPRSKGSFGKRSFGPRSSSGSGANADNTGARGGQDAARKKHFLCTYHERFGENARSCKPGCIMTPKQEAPNGQPATRT